MGMIKKIIRLIILFLFYGKKRFLLYGCVVICEKGGAFHVGKNVKLLKSKIYIHSGAQLTIGDYTNIKNTTLVFFSGEKEKISTIGESCKISDAYIIIKGNLIMGNGNIIEKGYYYRPVKFNINGSGFIGKRNRLRCVIWSRYNSRLNIGDYNNINEGSELRCDEHISIGDFNQISYECNIWDTNTHTIYKADQRRNLTISKYPVYGYEFEKPKTKPVIIGNDNWIGKNTTLLKGTVIGNRCIVGYGTILSHVKISDNQTVVQSNDVKIFSNSI